MQEKEHNKLTVTIEMEKKLMAQLQMCCKLAVNGQAITLVYVDSTKGWINVQDRKYSRGRFNSFYYSSNRWNYTTTCVQFLKFIHLQVQELFVSNVGGNAGGIKYS